MATAIIIGAAEIDRTCARIAELEQEAGELRDKLKEQVLEHGFTPPRADKSKRLLGKLFAVTCSTSTSVDLNDSAILKIHESCPKPLFEKLFRAEYRWKLVSGAQAMLAGVLPEGAPNNLRKLFSQAVRYRESAPRLRMETIEDSD